MDFIIKIFLLSFVFSCGAVIPTDKLLNSSINSSELSTIISNASDSFSATASDDSIASGAGVFIQPGSLAIGTKIDISAAEDLVSSDTGSILGTSDITAAGPAVFFESSGSTISANPMTITLPISSLGLSSQNIVVIYKVLDPKDQQSEETENFFLGVIPTGELNIKNSTVILKTSRFGAYQVAVSSEEITTQTEVETPLPIAKIDIETTDLIYGTWFTECYEYDNSQTKEAFQARVTINEDNSYSEKQYQYNTNSCSSINHLESIHVITGKIALGLADDNNVRNIDITPKKIYYSFKNTIKIDQSNTENLCGINNWEINKFKEVTTSSCVSETDTATYYSIIKATTKSIFMGNSHLHPANSPDTRPIEIDLEESLSRATN